MLENWSPKRGYRLREVVATGDSAVVHTRNSMPKSFYFYLIEKVFLHDKSCIRISLY